MPSITTHTFGNAGTTATCRMALTFAAFSLLAACGLNGTDRQDEERAAAAQPANPDFAAFEIAEMADSEPREQMRLQVVLDRLGFGPGIIDGREGASTANALKGFQEANGLNVTGEHDEPTRQALARWASVPATRVVRIPESWGTVAYRAIPENAAAQAGMERLGYTSLDEKLAERFHTTVAVLHELNPGGNPSGGTAVGQRTAPQPGDADRPSAGTPEAAPSPSPIFRAGQIVRVPNIALDGAAAPSREDAEWSATLASLGVSDDQPNAARIVVDKSEGWLKAFDAKGALVAMFTVTSGSEHDPLPLGEWGVNGISRNPEFSYDPALLRTAPDGDEKQQLPPGPNSPVGVAWIDLTKEHYGIHGTPDPEQIGRAQSNGCVRLTNWDVARLAQMVSPSTEVLFQG